MRFGKKKERKQGKQPAAQALSDGDLMDVAGVFIDPVTGNFIDLAAVPRGTICGGACAGCGRRGFCRLDDSVCLCEFCCVTSGVLTTSSGGGIDVGRPPG